MVASISFAVPHSRSPAQFRRASAKAQDLPKTAYFLGKVAIKKENIFMDKLAL
jgi:hypothetical protein